MKKFKFSIEPVDKYKRTVEKLQTGELRRAREALAALEKRREDLIREFSDTTAARETEMKSGLSVEDFLMYDRYFERLRRERAALSPRIARAKREVTEREAQLIRTKNELKAYGKLRSREVEAYNREVAAEEAQIINEFVSFNVTTGEDR
jgi:flagellar FliJ protein